MATSQVQLTDEQLNEEILNNALKDAIYEGEVSRSGVKDIFSGKEITKKAKYRLPIARTMDDAEKFSGSNVKELLYWFNYGRKVAARSQIFQALAGLDLGDEKINELYKSFNNAIDSLNLSEERKKKMQEFILSEEKFAPLKEAMANYTPEDLIVDFETTEIRKSTGKKGRRAGSKSSEEGSDE